MTATMNSIKTKFSILLLFAIGLTSCVKDVILDAEGDSQLVVACVLAQNSVQTLQLSWTKGPSEADAPRVGEASAVLTDLSLNREAGSFVRTGEGLWQLEYTPVPGHSYRLEVTIPGRDPVWAEQTMPEVPVVESAVIPRAAPFTHGTRYGLMYRSNFDNTVWAWAENYDAASGQHKPVDQICTDYPYVDNINLSGEEYTVTNWPPFFPPKDESLGYAYNEYCVYGHAMHHRFLRFPKKEFTYQEQFAIGGNFKGNYYYYDEGSQREPSGTEGILYFAYLSDEYDRYLCEAFSYYQAEVSDDLSSVYRRDNIYTNIHGGVGIFGAYTQVPVRWDYAYVRVVSDGLDNGTVSGKDS